MSASGDCQSRLDVRGIVSMARTDEPNSATTHFFILVGPGPHLDSKFSAFGSVTKGMEVVDAIKELAEHHKPWVKASALMGLTPLMRIIYRAVVALTRREIRVCETRDEAVAYLLGKRGAVSGPSTAAPASPRKP